MTWQNGYRKDCIFFMEDDEMGSTVQYCTLFGMPVMCTLCGACKEYCNVMEARKIIRELRKHEREKDI